MQSEKSFPITCILCFLFGIWGIHRFYVGKFITAILMVLTFGGLGVWTLIDFIRIVTGNFKDGSGLVIKSGGKLASQATGSSSTTPAKSKSLLIWVALGSALFFVLVIVAIFGGPRTGLPSIGEQVVTLDNYLEIRNDMSYSQVVRIIGTDGVENSQNRIEGIPGVMDPIVTIMYSWTNGNGSGMNAIFQNDKLFQKSQFALK